MKDITFTVGEPWSIIIYIVYIICIIIVISLIIAKIREE